jgi:hypothetical protein
MAANLVVETLAHKLVDDFNNVQV